MKMKKPRFKKGDSVIVLGEFGELNENERGIVE
jgi:hypothetical protein